MKLTITEKVTGWIPKLFTGCWLTMKLVTILIAATLIQANARSHAQTITYSGKNVNIERVFKAIKKQTGYVFFYRTDDLAKVELVSLELKNVMLEPALNEIFREQPVGFEIINKTIFIKSKPVKPTVPVVTQTSPQVPPPITGVVLDEVGKPIPGASVSKKGTTLGAAADANGSFTLDLKAGDVIVISAIGYKRQELTIKGSGELTIKLEPDILAMGEVVVVGYGTKLKGELTGAVSKVGSKTFQDRPLTNAMNALQGAMPGVTVLRGSGQPGNEGYNIQIRGSSSINGNKPLVLIDGIPGDLNLINPNDIGDITVLKDAAASIYGARAADGVVIVTTKRGKNGPPVISYSGNFGIKQPKFLKKRTTTLQLAEMYDEGMRNVGQVGVSADVFAKIKANAEPDPTGWLKYLENFPGFYQTHSWIDEVFGPGYQQSHNINVSGGGENNSYLFSAGYLRNTGVFRYGKNYSDRYNLRMNYDFKLSDRLNFETKTSFENQPRVEPTSMGSTLYFVNQMGSYVPIYTPKGQLYKYQGGFRNPIQYLQESGTLTENQNRLSTNAKGTYNIFDDLKLVGQVGIVMDFNNGSTTNPTFAQYNWDESNFNVVNLINNAQYRYSKNIYQNYTGYLDYNKTIGSKHRINAMVGASREKNTNEGITVTGYNFPNNEIMTLNLADRTKTEYANFTGIAPLWALQSYFSRVSYSFDRKYLIDVTARQDISTKFSANKRKSAVFPAVSAAWNISDEAFMSGSKVFDNLKLRASWGQSGNQELNFGNFDYIPLVTISGNYPFGTPPVGLPGASTSFASKDRTWETIETRNVGVDFGFLKSRLTGSLELYTKSNKNMLVNDQLPAVLGGTAPTQNIGKLETKGWDLSLGWNDQVGDFRYSILFNLSDSKNKLLELKGNDAYNEGLVNTRKGYSLASYFGYQFDGIIQNSEQLAAYQSQLTGLPNQLSVGDVRYKDVDGDGKITAFGDPAKGTKGDLVYIGNRLPRYTYSSNINLAYKGFDLGVILQGVGKRQAVRTGEWAYPFTSVWIQPLEYFYGKNWSSTNTDAPYPRIVPGVVGADPVRDWNWRYSSMRMNNLAYLRVKVLTLGYNVPETFVQKIRVKSARVYFSAQDLFTFSRDSWNKSFDPEENWERTDDQTYPFSSVISFGIDLKF